MPEMLTTNIILANIAGATEAIQAKIPKLETVRRDVRRQPAATIGYPPIPETTKFEIVPPFNAINTGEQFTYNGRDDQIIIFATSQSLFLHNCEDWFMDKTISSALSNPWTSSW